MDEMSLKDLPKVLLHDHLDGGLRPATLVELAAEQGYRRLPTTKHEPLSSWLRSGGEGSIKKVLWAYGHMVAVMQTADGIERVAREAAEDLREDNIVYAELRLAPTEHTARGLSPGEVIEAATRGLEAGGGTDLVAELVLVSMRQRKDSEFVAELAVRYHGHGVVGFDLAGLEDGHPLTDHVGAFEIARAGNLSITVHAGDEDGIESIIEAINMCGADRIGVGFHIVDEISVSPDGSIELGPRAAAIRDARTHLEICPTAGLHMHGITHSEHPVGLLRRAGFEISVNTDSRILFAPDMTHELEMVTRHHDFTVDDLRMITFAAADAAFCDDDTKETVRARVEQGFAGL